MRGPSSGDETRVLRGRLFNMTGVTVKLTLNALASDIRNRANRPIEPHECERRSRVCKLNSCMWVRCADEWPQATQSSGLACNSASPAQVQA